MSAARNPYQARPFRRIRTIIRRKRRPQQIWRRPGAQRPRQQRRPPPRHEDRTRDRIAPTRSGRQVGRADRRHWVVAAYRASRADRPSPSRLRRPPGAWRNRPRLGLPRRRNSRGQRVIPMRPSPKSLTRRPINSAAEPHGRTAAGSLDQNNSVATRRVVDEGVRSCPRAGCGRSARPVVCPAKAGMFSRRKACRGKKRAALRHRLDAVLAVGERRLDAEEIDHLREGDGDHGEIDADRADGERTDDETERGRRGDAERDRRDRFEAPDFRGVGADVVRQPQEHRVPEREEVDVADQQVEGAGEEGEAERFMMKNG